MVSKRNLFFQGLIFRFHVKLQGCISIHMFSDFVSHNEPITLCPTAVRSSVWLLLKLANFRCFQEKQTFSYLAAKVESIIQFFLTINLLRLARQGRGCRCQRGGWVETVLGANVHPSTSDWVSDHHQPLGVLTINQPVVSLTISH